MTGVAETQVRGDLDEAIAQVEESLSIVFGRARSVYKDAAAQIHPELQPVGYKILSSIVRQGDTTALALSDLLDTDKSVVSRQVRMLEDAGLVVSRPDEKDGRMRVLSATAHAVERVRAVRTSQQNRLRDRLRTLPEEDVRAFARMLHLLGEP